MNKSIAITLGKARRLLGAAVLTGVGLFSATLSGSAWATDEADLIDAEGIVQEVFVSEGRVQITGFQYDVEPHANVQVRGSASSIAALQPGMKVRFVYEVIEGLAAEVAARDETMVISELEQLPDSYVVEEF